MNAPILQDIALVALMAIALVCLALAVTRDDEDEP